jgi:hypothetical protein
VISEEQIKRRLPVWSALADLFLDTEFDPSYYKRIAKICGASGYSRPELKRIFFDEVAPAFAFNLYDIAGEWTGWPDEFVKEKILRDLTPRRSIWHRIKRAILLHQMEKEWVRVEALL